MRALTRDAPSVPSDPATTRSSAAAIRAVLDRGQPCERETPRGRGRGLPGDELHLRRGRPARPARVLESCPRARVAAAGPPGFAGSPSVRPVSSSLSSSSSSSSLRSSPPRTRFVGSSHPAAPGVGGGTSYVDLRLTGTPRTSLACVAGSLARVDRGPQNLYEPGSVASDTSSDFPDS